MEWTVLKNRIAALEMKTQCFLPAWPIAADVYLSVASYSVRNAALIKYVEAAYRLASALGR